MKLNYIIIPAMVFGVAAISSLFSRIGIDSGWYSGIIKPDWIPRENVIEAVWVGIYALTAMSLLILWNRTAHDGRLKHILQSFTFNAVLNVAWIYIFFVRNQMGVALIIAILMWFSVVEIMYNSWPVKKTVVFLLFPYVVWLIIVSVANYMIWKAN